MRQVEDGSPPQASLSQLFAEQAAEHRDDIALEHGATSLTYAEVDARSTRLASSLVDRGVQPEDIVAVALPRSADLIVCLLAVSKAGAAFLPLDTRFPLRRIDMMLADASPRLMITDQDGASVLPMAPQRPVVTLDDVYGDQAPSGRSAETPTPGQHIAVDVRSLAYVFYTSGSTGKPKGVAVTHSGIANVAASQRKRLGIGPGSRVLQFASPSFDVIAWELMTLLLGGTLVVCDAADLQPGPALVRLFWDRRISHSVLPPAVLPLLEGYGGLPSGVTLVLAGEAWPGSLVEQWSDSVTMINGYGPTEATVGTTLTGPLLGADDPPLGAPLDGVRVHVLGANLKPVEADAVGELYIAGTGLARGYLGQPALTADRFIACPFGSAGERMYRTGDLVRVRGEGELVYVGRADHQVELHGIRIELTEVEVTLAAHPTVKVCAVMVREDTPGTRRLVAYVVTVDREEVRPAELRTYLGQRLPSAMLPSLYVQLDTLPLTPVGYVDRAALPTPETVPSFPTPNGQEPDPGGHRLVSLDDVRELWCEVLGVPSVGLDVSFFEAGGTSLLALRLHRLLADRHGVEIDLAALFEHSTVRQLVEHIGPVERGPGLDEEASRNTESSRIAVIGMAGRFPGAADVDELWELLEHCREGLTHHSSATSDLGADVREVGTIGRPPSDDEFDADLFGFAAADARDLDPQLGLFLETVWEALEHAGYAPNSLTESVGVFGGTGIPYRWLDALRATDGDGVARQRVEFANPMQFLCGHTAHRLGLRGPALTINTACSTSLVAVHLACRSLLAGECTLALAGGVSLLAPGARSYTYEEGGSLSPDGHCRPFDLDGQGTVPAGGSGVVVLKRLEDAVADGDTVHAVISGSAVNNDGARKVGFTAPSVEGQVEVLAAAHRAARVSSDEVGYVQAHGTATALGDAIEMRALTRVFASSVLPRERKCFLGSVKSNVGHLDAAAGVTGLITAVLAIQHRRIPGVVHFNRPNPHLNLDRSPFSVNPATIDWISSPGQVRRAGVSAFGVGGTNAHVVIEEPPPQFAPVLDSRPQVLAVSARTPQTLNEECARLAKHLSEAGSDVALADVAFTLQQGRAAFGHRRAVVCEEPRSAADLLTVMGHPDVFIGMADDQKVAFLFPGGGSQHPHMGHELYVGEPAFRSAFDECADPFDAALGCDLRSLTFSAGTDSLFRPSLNMASIIATEIAVVSLLRSWGVIPSVLLGHSLGEYAAAHVAGVLSLPDLVDLVVLRGRQVDQLPPAASLVVGLSEDEVRPLLDDRLSLACVNSAKNCVISGSAEEITRLERDLRRDRVTVRRLEVAGGTHSDAMTPILGEFEEQAAKVALRKPRIPLVSGLTGTWMDPTRAPDAGYWAEHLRNTARLADGLTTLLDDPALALIQVGPGRTLTQSALLHPRCGDTRTVANTLMPGVSEHHLLGLLVAQLWCHGVPIDWSAVHHHPRRRVPLPTSRFKRGVLQEPRRNSAKSAVRTAMTDSVLAELWRELLGVDTVGPHDDFFRSGGDSHLAIVFRRRIQERLGTRISVHTLLKNSTFDALARSLTPHRAADPLLIPLRTGGTTRTPLYLVQPLGGTVYSYRGLAKHLSQDRSVYGFRACGLEPGEPIPSTVPDIAARDIADLIRLSPGPYVLGGHSAGAVIAHEMAHQLTEAGLQVPLVVMIDTPSLERHDDLPDADNLLAALDDFRESAPRAWQAMRAALDHDPQTLDVTRATVDAIRRHRPVAVPSALLYVRARDRDEVGSAPEDYWSDLHRGGATVHTAAGNHLTIVEEPYVQAIAEEIERGITNVERSGAPNDTSAPSSGLVRTPSGLLVEGLTVAQIAEFVTLVDGIGNTGGSSLPGVNIVDRARP